MTEQSTDVNCIPFWICSNTVVACTRLYIVFGPSPQILVTFTLKLTLAPPSKQLVPVSFRGAMDILAPLSKSKMLTITKKVLVSFRTSALWPQLWFGGVASDLGFSILRGHFALYIFCVCKKNVSLAIECNGVIQQIIRCFNCFIAETTLSEGCNVGKLVYSWIFSWQQITNVFMY